VLLLLQCLLLVLVLVLLLLLLLDLVFVPQGDASWWQRGPLV
jgi:hypothetical protein